MKPAILPPTNRDAMIAGIAKMLAVVFPGKPVRVKWEIARPDRTPQENRYWWGVPIAMLSDATGYEKEELHEFFCGSYWGWKTTKCPKTPCNPEGQKSEPIRTTTTDADGNDDLCSEDDFLALWAMAQRRGAFLGIAIPDPDKHHWLNKREPTRSKTP